MPWKRGRFNNQRDQRRKVGMRHQFLQKKDNKKKTLSTHTLVVNSLSNKMLYAEARKKKWDDMRLLSLILSSLIVLLSACLCHEVNWNYWSMRQKVKNQNRSLSRLTWRREKFSWLLFLSPSPASSSSLRSTLVLSFRPPLFLSFFLLDHKHSTLRVPAFDSQLQQCLPFFCFRVFFTTPSVPL